MTRRVILALAATLLSAAAAAQGEHERRLAAELAVMAGDARDAASGTQTAARRAGLQDRLAGALSSLPLLLRRAGAEAGAAAALRAALARHDWRALDSGLRTLRRKHPFDAAAILPASASPGRMRLGAAIHRQACAGCHDAPAADAQRPAFDLFEQSRRMPRAEFAARLLTGVRGDRSTAWRNPFSDLELGALMAYYESGVTAGAKPGVAP